MKGQQPCTLSGGSLVPVTVWMTVAMRTSEALLEAETMIRAADGVPILETRSCGSCLQSIQLMAPYPGTLSLSAYRLAGGCRK